jgi:hypothetical protein
MTDSHDDSYDRRIVETYRPEHVYNTPLQWHKQWILDTTL